MVKDEVIERIRKDGHECSVSENGILSLSADEFKNVDDMEKYVRSIGHTG